MSNNVALAAPPASTGCFRIPAIDEAVPARFAKDLQRAQTLARFAKASECAGVPLPTGDFLNIEQVVAAQWNQFLSTNYPQGVFDGLAGEPVMGVYDDSLQVKEGLQASRVLMHKKTNPRAATPTASKQEPTMRLQVVPPQIRPPAAVEAVAARPGAPVPRAAVKPSLNKKAARSRPAARPLAASPARVLPLLRLMTMTRVNPRTHRRGATPTRLSTTLTAATRSRAVKLLATVGKRWIWARCCAKRWWRAMVARRLTPPIEMAMAARPQNRCPTRSWSGWN